MSNTHPPEYSPPLLALTWLAWETTTKKASILFLDTHCISCTVLNTRNVHRCQHKVEFGLQIRKGTSPQQMGHTLCNSLQAWGLATLLKMWPQLVAHAVSLGRVIIGERREIPDTYCTS